MFASFIFIISILYLRYPFIYFCCIVYISIYFDIFIDDLFASVVS